MPVCPKCGQTSDQLGAKCPRDEYYFISEEGLEDAERDPVIGTLAADKYVILSLINEGGMGAVYRALQLPVEREVAFKVLRAELKDSDQGRDRFIREARAVSRLTHPNIITLHDFGFDQKKHPYMVMEYAPGKSLAEWLKDEQVTADRVTHIGEQILSALTDAHEEGIVHRDLKPENMIITKSGNDHDFVKLLDFGIARLINEGSTRGLTREGEVFGTPHYMAPEQAQGQKSVGPPADVYAVGIMLYEMVTGRCPFDAPTPLSVLFMHINEPLPAIEPRNGLVMSPALEAVIRRAAAKDVKERYQDGGEMLTALQQASSASASAHAGAGLNSVVGELRKDTIAPGSQPLDVDSTKPMNRQPQITPTPAVNVGVYDPEPSVERPMFDTGEKYEQPYDTDRMIAEQTGSRTRLGLVAAIAVLALFLLGGVVYGLVSDSDEEVPEEPAAENVQPEDPAHETAKPKEEVAVKKATPDPKAEAASKEKEETETNDPSAESDPKKDETSAVATKEVAEPAEKDEPERVKEGTASKTTRDTRRDPRPKTEKTTRPKTQPKDEPTSDSTSTAEKTAEKEEAEEDKVKPMKFQPVKKDPRKW